MAHRKHLDLSPARVRRGLDVSGGGCAGKRFLRGLVGCVRCADRRQGPRPCQPRTSRALRPPQALPKQRRARSAGERTSYITCIGGGRCLVRQVGRFVDDCARTRRQLNSATEGLERRAGGSPTELEQPARPLEPRMGFTIGPLGQRLFYQPNSSLDIASTPSDQRTHLGDSGATARFNEALGRTEVSRVPRQAGHGRLSAPTGRARIARDGPFGASAGHGELPSPPRNLGPERVDFGPRGQSQRRPRAPRLARAGERARQLQGQRRRAAHARDLVFGLRERPGIR